MQITVPANKLENVEVDYISLVARGANRVPFRIIKQEKGMINLSNLKSLLKKSAPAKAEMYGIVLPKAVATEAVLKAIAAAGAKVDKAEEKDGTILLQQMDGEAGDKAVVLKLSDHVAIVMKAFHGHMGNGSDFDEILKTQGFFPGFSMATEALYTAVRNVLMDDAVKSTSDAVSKVDSALDQFHEYVVGILSEVPPTAFKVEKAVADTMEAVAKAEQDKGDAEKKAKDEADAKAKGDAEAKAKADAEAIAKAGFRLPDGTCMEGYEEMDGKCVKMKSKEADPLKKDDLLKEIGASVQTMLGDALKVVTTAITEINKNVTGLTTKVDGITKAHDELKVQVTQAVETAKKAEATLKGTTIGGLPLDDPKNKRATERQDGSLGNIDTAFQPGVRKKASAYSSLLAERTRAMK
jgi:hypothetical protein